MSFVSELLSKSTAILKHRGSDVSPPTICFETLSGHAIVPTIRPKGAPSYDVKSAHDYIIPEGEKRFVDTDMRITLPRGCDIDVVADVDGKLICEGFNLGISTDMRGNVGVCFFNPCDESHTVYRGTVIARITSDRPVKSIVETALTLSEEQLLNPELYCRPRVLAPEKSLKALFETIDDHRTLDEHRYESDKICNIEPTLQLRALERGLRVGLEEVRLIQSKTDLSPTEEVLLTEVWSKMWMCDIVSGTVSREQANPSSGDGEKGWSRRFGVINAPRRRWLMALSTKQVYALINRVEISPKASKPDTPSQVPKRSTSGKPDTLF